MITPYVAQQPVDDFGLNFSNLKYIVKLTNTLAVSFVVPGNAPRYKAVIKIFGNSQVFVAFNKPAVLPTGAFFQLTDSEIIAPNAMCREVKAGDTISVVTETINTIVSIVLYSINTAN